MTSPPPTHPDLERFLHLLAVPDREGALGLARRVRRATPEDDVIVSVFAPALRRVGELWQSGAWNVAQEHAATSIVDAALADLELVDGGDGDRGEVVVACAEGEWHSLPARMVAALLRRRGWAVVFVGASTPAPHLQTLVRPGRTAGLLVSCSVSAALLGAQRSIDAGHRAGVPVLAGGAGFGPDDRRALALGADGHAVDGVAADAILARWAMAPPTPTPSRLPAPAALALAAIRPDLLDAAMAAVPADAVTDELRSRLGLLLQFVEAALLCDDPTIVSESRPWFEEGLVAHGLPARTLSRITRAVAAAIPADQPAARSVLDAALTSP